jgi:acetyl esterase/lipase
LRRNILIFSVSIFVLSIAAALFAALSAPNSADTVSYGASSAARSESQASHAADSRTDNSYNPPDREDTEQNSAPVQSAEEENVQSDDVYPMSAVYKRVGELELRLSFYPPDRSARSASPVLIYFHSESETSGMTGETIENMRQRGYVVASAEYRMTDPSDMLSDACDAIDYVRDNASEIGINPDGIVTSGHSIGGFAAIYAGSVRNVSCAVGFSAVISLPAAAASSDESSNYFTPELTGIISCPTVLVHSRDDQTVPFSSALELHDYAVDNSIKIRLIPISGVGHDLASPSGVPSASADEITEKIIDFIGIAAA